MAPRASRTKPPVAQKPRAAAPRPNVRTFEAELLPGLEPFVTAELKTLSGVRSLSVGEGAVGFGFVGDTQPLESLRTVTAVFDVLFFALPRPKALLGHEHLTRLKLAVADLRRRQTFGSFRLAAAGRESSVFARFIEAFAQQTGLKHDPDEGELLVRVRRASGAREGWEVLLRLTPRPLSARPWRVCNRAGGLNASLAAAMVALAGAGPSDRVFNPLCGSGTLLAEQGLKLAPARLVGCDQSPAALECSAQNLEAAGIRTELLELDATATGLRAHSFEVIVSDPPWGDAIGRHGVNAVLYPALLREFARLAAPSARLVLLTHELRLFERVLAEQTFWRTQTQLQVFHGGHYPHLYLLVAA